MANYKIEIKKSAAKEISKLPQKVLVRIVEQIQLLSETPRPHGCKKLSGDEKYRVRVGNYRILYTIEDNILTLYIVKVGHRKNIYEML
ncbi:MAG: type II toxin-antitoxin system RelE/ParE family toxin [Campylobacterota bacterium]|nr:type II toxin-antitoxin system RelE/ParE family toxin [Campylobacterota bacterium]